jgi:hypothetical protein
MLGDSLRREKAQRSCYDLEYHLGLIRPGQLVRDDAPPEPFDSAFKEE